MGTSESNQWRISNILPISEYGGKPWLPVSNYTHEKLAFLANSEWHSPRDGRQISIAQFDQSIVDSLNFSPDFAHTITTNMLTKLGVITKNAAVDSTLRLDLEQTNAHDKTEHDASITRLDFSQGDNLHVQVHLVQQFLDDSVPMDYPYVNASSVGRTRVRRERESLAAGNPPLSDLFFNGAQGEAALVLLIFGEGSGPVTAKNAEARKAPKEQLRSWLINERFPTDQGFKRSSRQVQAAENGFLVSAIAKWQASMEGGTSSGKGNDYVVMEGYGIH
jgi:hypothetical protein